MMRKEDLLQAYVRRSLSLSRDRLRKYVFDLEGKKRYQRHAFIRFEKYVNAFLDGDTDKRWIIMPGLRGTGKTTLVAQLYYTLSNKGVPVAYMPYVSLDDLTSLVGLSLKDFLDAYERHLGKNFESLSKSEEIFLFVDEAHYDKDWALTLKSLYDRTDRVFILTTGSSSVSLQTSPDTVRRAEVERLFPLSFTEYMLLKSGLMPKKGVKKSVANAVFSSESADEVLGGINVVRRGINEYLADVSPSDVAAYLRMGTLPFSIPHSNPDEFYDKVVGMVEKTVSEDISMIMGFTKKMQTKMSNLIMLLALSDRMSYPTLCNALGDITKPTLSRMIRGLEKSELIHAVRPFGRPVKKIAKTPKYKFMAPSVRAALLWQVGELDSREETSGKLLEDAVAMYLFRLLKMHELLGFDFDATEGGADFIVTARDKSRVVLEVGFGDKGFRQIEKSMERSDSKYGVLVSDRRPSASSDRRIVSVPRDWFLLM